MIDDPVDLDARREARPVQFLVRDASEFEGKPIPGRDWLVPSVLVRRSLTLFSGDGGTGKSLLCLQMQVAAALGKEWLGLQMPEKLSSFAFYCEDDEQEIHRRLDDLCKFYGCSFADLDGRVRFVSRVGEDNELVVFRGYKDSAKATRTQLFRQIENEVKESGAQLIVIDTAADAFAGNENIRSQVRAFVNLLRRLALINNGGVILNAHPSKSAMLDGSGFSGSTAWNGSVRNRLYLTRPKSSDSEEDDGQTDERVLKVMKSNYGPFGEKMKCRWEKGVFVRTDNAQPGSIVDRLSDNARVMKAVEYLISRGTKLSAAPKARNALVNEIRELPSCKDLSWGAAVAIQDRLIEQRQLVIVEIGPPARRFAYIRPSHMRYPGEKE